MSAACVDYDQDGDLDIYTGNMFSAAGLRVTTLAGFQAGSTAGIRALFQRHARGNALFHNRGDGKFADVTLEAGADSAAGPGHETRSMSTTTASRISTSSTGSSRAPPRKRLDIEVSSGGR